MLINGEKWACDACVKGHRVSNCQHRGHVADISQDRKLQHINKKGRPVSQCTHCRGLRKSRSAHVKCDCGEKGHTKGQCSHNEKGESRVDSSGELSDSHSNASGSDLSAVGNQPCCCSHGTRCTCALKKEELEPVQELILANDPIPRDSQTGKPRLTSAQSDGSLTVFSNGHHKPIHKYNNMAHKCGAPYQIPRPHTIHGPSHFAPRSVDSLPLSNADRLSPPSEEPILGARKDEILSRSEHGSPLPRANPNFQKLNGRLPPLDLSYPAYNNGTSYQSQNDFSALSSASFDAYTSTPDAEQSLFPLGLNLTSEDWSAYQWPMDEALLTSNSQPPSCASFSHSNLSQPHISSGDLSDVEDLTPFSNPSPLDPPAPNHKRLASDASELRDADSYRLSSDSYLGLTQTSMPPSKDITSSGIDDYLSGLINTEPVGDVSLGGQTAAGSSSLDHFSFDQGLTTAPSIISAEEFGSDLPVASSGLDSLWIPGFNNGMESSLDPEHDIPDNLWSS
ncbi:MAG: hypothetical protein M1812_006906 [Candelaria pacifica]|nr:MAG: hypothetical protein M1812_006906 [Candelaria pacifica]